MSKSTRGARVAGIASLAVTLSIGVAAPAFAVADFAFDRIGGEDRYETAALVADEYGAKPDAIVANGQPGFYADALASNYLSGAEDAPILLTRIKELPQHTLDQLDQMNAQNVTIVGGESVVPAAQEQQLKDAGYTVTRIAGDDRFETNADVLAADGASTGGVGLIATGFNFPDALAAGPFAYNGHSLGLSTKDDVKDVVLDALVADGVKEVLIFGGTDAVGPGVEADLASRGITVKQRFAGADRSETSELAAEWALKNLNFTNKHVGVASGYTLGYGADALAGGPLEGKQDAPMLITRNVDNPDDVNDFLKAHCSTLETGHLFGGPAAVSVAAEASMEAAASCAGASNQDFTATPSETATNSVSATTDDTSTTENETNRGRRTYTVTGLDNAQTYDIALFPAENVTVAAGGAVTFADANDNNVADFTATSGRIELVNNAAPSTADANGVVLDVTPVNGTIQFTIDSTTPDQVRPVLFRDADNGSSDAAPDLDLDAANQPSELFAVGGQKNWTATAAPSSANLGDGRVSTLDKTANVAGIDTGATPGDADYDAADADFTVTYDANDSFQIAGVPATIDEFEAQLSRGDYLTIGNYSTNSALVSQFNISYNGPDAPVVDAVVANSNDVTVTITPTEPGDLADYSGWVIQRAPVVGGEIGTYQTIATATTDASTAAGFQYRDNDVPAGTYRYRAAGVIDGDQGAFGTDDADVTTTNPGPDGTAPVSEYAAVITDSGFAGEANTGDVWRMIFNEPVNVGAGDALRVSGGGDAEQFEIVCGTNATCSTNTTATTIGGESYAAGEVVTITLTANPAPVAPVTGGDNRLAYPAVVVNQSGYTDTAGNNWALAGDKTFNVDASAPDMNAALADRGDDAVTLTYTSPVNCADVAGTRNQFTYSDNTTVSATPTAIECGGDTSVVLTFAAGTIEAGDTTGSVVYTQSATPAQRITGLNGRDAVSPDTQSATFQD